MLRQLDQLSASKMSAQQQSQLKELRLAADRMRAEQVALVRCWSQSHRMCAQVADFLDATEPQVRSAADHARKLVARSLQKLQPLDIALQAVTAAAANAEAARVPTASRGGESSSSSASASGAEAHSRSGASNAAVAIAPIDSLARGAAGAEVAALVSSLRLHRDTLLRAAEVLNSVTAQLDQQERSSLRTSAEHLQHRAAIAGDMRSSLQSQLRASDAAHVAPADAVGGRRKRSDKRDGASAAAVAVAGAAEGKRQLPRGDRARSEADNAAAVRTPPPPRPPFDLSF